MKVIASTMIAGVSAQFYSYPTTMGGGFNAYPASYGMSTGFGYGGGFGGFGGGYGGGFGGGFGGGYGGGYGDYGRECRKGVTSDDLNGYARCYCDKNHRDEDPCNEGRVDGGECTQESFREKIVYDAFDDYYDDIFDEDCVLRSSPPANIRRCRKGVYSKDLPSTAACWCDAHHKKYLNNLDDLDDCDFFPMFNPDTAQSQTNDDFWVAAHYDLHGDDVEKICSCVPSFVTKNSGTCANFITDRAVCEALFQASTGQTFEDTDNANRNNRVPGCFITNKGNYRWNPLTTTVVRDCGANVKTTCICSNLCPSGSEKNERAGEDFKDFDPNCVQRYGGNYGGYYGDYGEFGSMKNGFSGYGVSGSGFGGFGQQQLGNQWGYMQQLGNQWGYMQQQPQWSHSLWY